MNTPTAERPARHLLDTTKHHLHFARLPWSLLREVLHLTPRELEIVQQLFESQTEREIASRLGIAVRTVHTHLERVHRKLAVQSRAQLLTLIVGTSLDLNEQADWKPHHCQKCEYCRCPACATI
jgi:DNA-binding CsgD family transcriptional regulator